MNLVEKLKAIDQKKIDAIQTKELYSKQLSKLFGDVTFIRIQAIDGELFSSLSGTGLDKNGDVDYNRVFSANAKIVAEGVIEPNLKDESLLKHLGVASPAEAAKKIFHGEINTISVEITELSGFLSEQETEKQVKN